MEKTEGEDTLERDPEDLEVSEKQTPAESSAGPSTVVPPVYLLQTRAPIAARYLNILLLYSRRLHRSEMIKAQGELKHPNFFLTFHTTVTMSLV